MFPCHDDALDALPGCSEVRSCPTHVPGNLADHAISGAAAFELHDHQCVRRGIDAKDVQAADKRDQLMSAGPVWSLPDL
jgi:hypothetical protein